MEYFKRTLDNMSEIRVIGSPFYNHSISYCNKDLNYWSKGYVDESLYTNSNRSDRDSLTTLKYDIYDYDQVANMKEVYSLELEDNKFISHYNVRWLNFFMLIDSLSNNEVYAGLENMRHIATKVTIIYPYIVDAVAE